MPLSPALQTAILQKLAEPLSSGQTLHLQPVGGGSINHTYRLSFASKTFFCKQNSATKFPHLFQKERQGLCLLADQGIIRTPAVLNCFEADGEQVLLLEWIEEGNPTAAFWKKFGEQLARLHLVSAERFGLATDNYMGSVPQQNTLHKSWCAFFSAERLAPMVARCVDKKLLSGTVVSQFDTLQQKLPEIFDKEKPSLLHGDLWSGNFLCNTAAEPVLIDPAVYFGHRSVDLAMTTLFGGFAPSFYDAYRHYFPLPRNYHEQWAICNLYPLLIHLYLFGRQYLAPIEQTLNRFA